MKKIWRVLLSVVILAVCLLLTVLSWKWMLGLPPVWKFIAIAANIIPDIGFFILVIYVVISVFKDSKKPENGHEGSENK